MAGPMTAAADFPGFSAGDDVTETYHWQDDAGATINLTGRTYRAQIRMAQNSQQSWEFTITPDLVNGNITLSFASAFCADIPPGRWFWALQETIAGKSQEIIKGRVDVSANTVR